MTTHFFQWKNKRIAYSINGKGKCILLLHGYTESKGIWVDFCEDLAHDYCIICPDIPGHGESELLENNSIQDWADTIVALIKNHNYSTCVAIGHSMGGYILSNMAARFPHMIEGLGYFHSSAKADSQEVRENRMRTIDIISQGKGTFLNKFISDLFAPENQEKYDAQIKALQQKATQISTNALIISQKSMAERSSQIEMLSSAKFPILYIIGKKDKRSDIKAIIEQVFIAKKTSVLILENCGHMGYIEAKEETLAAVKGFISLANIKS